MPPTVRQTGPPTRPTTQVRPKGAGNKVGVLTRIVPIGFDESEGIKILLYGRSGTGKTTLWSTFPGPILSIICSGSSNPGELRSVDTPENREKISTVTLVESREFAEVIDHVHSSKSYGTVVLDHASGLADLVLKEILNLNELPAQKGWGLASQQQYGQLALQCKELLRAFLGLRCNVVIIAQERTFGDESAQSEFIAPTVGAALSPSIAGWLNTAVDYICQTHIRQATVLKETTIGSGANAKKVQREEAIRGKVEYCLRVAPDPVYTTKFRVPRGQNGQNGATPASIVDPSYDKIMKVIRPSS
jgi:hypothetical protein